MSKSDEGQANIIDDELLSVYITEDSPVIRDRLIETVSRNRRMRVAGAADTANDTISHLRMDPVDVIILDLQLRQGNGFDVLKFLAAAPVRPRIIVLTCHSQPAIKSACQQLGADYFFDKAKDYEHLQALLGNLAD